MFSKALEGAGRWFADQNGIDRGSTTAPSGLRYCTASDITGALPADVTRHESADPPGPSHYSIWVDVLNMPEPKALLESIYFDSRLPGPRNVSTLVSRWGGSTGAAAIYQVPWGETDIGVDHAVAQQRIGCAFDNNPGD